MKQLFTALLLFTMVAAQAQSWQWGKRGGSSDGSNSGPEEEVIDMTTDKQGNVYVLARTHQNAVNIDGYTTTGFGRGNMVIASWSCSGQRRWVKYIGSYDGNYARAIGVDSLGGVYIAGTLTSQNSFGYFKVDTDTAFTLPTYKSMFLLKLDTAGVYKWLRMPQADTVSFWMGSHKTSVLDMAIENNGTVHLLSQLLPGAYNNGALVTSNLGLYMMRFDRNGNYLNNAPLQITIPTSGVSGIGVTRDPRNGRYYFTGMAGGGGTSFGGHPANTGFYITAYNAQGQFIWFRQNTALYPYIGGRAAIDNQGFVYITGSTYPGDIFNGYTFANPLTSIPHGVPFVIKLDSAGNNIWAVNGHVNAGTGGSGVSVSNGIVAIAGGYPGLVKFGSYQVSNITNTGYDVFLARFNASSGAPVGIDSLKSPVGFHDKAQAVAADRQGNFYVSGTLDAQLNIPNQSPLISNGGETDWFVAKFGTDNCNCTVPEAAYTYSLNSSTNTATLSYSGITVGLDSLVWAFGDGEVLTVTANYATPVLHTYAASGSQNVCVTAYNSCGQDQFCQAILLTTGIVDSSEMNKLSIQPNPNSGKAVVRFTSANQSEIQFSILNLLGQEITKTVKTTDAGQLEFPIDLQNQPSGIYLLKIQEGDKTYTVKLVRQ